MDITDKLQFHYKKLKSDVYINHIWKVICAENESLRVDEAVVEDYDNHLPIHFGQFLHDCTALVNRTENKINYIRVPKMYILSLIYTGLKSDDADEEHNSTPMKASVFFMSLFITSRSQWELIKEQPFSFFFKKILTMWKQRVNRKCYLSFEAVNSLKRILDTSNFDMSPYSSRIVCMLSNNITKHTRHIDFDSDDISEVDVATYAIYKLYLLKLNRCNCKKSDVVIPIVLKLLEFLANDSHCARENALNFHDKYANVISSPFWYCKSIAMLFEKHVAQDIILFLNQIPLDKYFVTLKLILNDYVKATTEEQILRKMEILPKFIDNIHPGLSEELRESFIERIIKETFVRLTHNSFQVVEKAMSIYIKYMKKKDIHFKRVLQRIITNQKDVISGRTLFHLLFAKCDIQWKNINFNVRYIELTCLMFLANRSFVLDQRVKVIEALCMKAAGSFLIDCIPVFIDIILKYVTENGQLAKSMLAIVVYFALNSGGMYDKYVRAIFDMISPIFDKFQDNEKEFVICNILLTEDFDYVGLFKAMDDMKLIKCEHMEVLVEHRILKSPTTWKLLVVLLDYVNYDKFPSYMQYYHTKFISVNFYDSDESLYTIQVLTKMFSLKVQHNKLTISDNCLARSLENGFKTLLLNWSIRKKHINDIILLSLVLGKITKNGTAWLSDLFDNCKKFIRTHLPKMMFSLVLSRVLFCMGTLVQHVEVNFSDEDMLIIEEYLSEGYQRKPINKGNSEVLSGIIYFYGKYVLKCAEITNSQILKLQIGLTHNSTVVQQTAMAIMYDICNLRLNYFDTLDVALIAAFQSNNIEVVNSALQILMKLINEDHIKLSVDDYVKVFSLLFNRNIKVSFFHNDALEKQFIQKNEPLTVKYFIHLIMYLNNYKDHVLFQLEPNTTPNIEYTQERKNMLFKMTYGNMQRMNQFQIITVIIKDILENIYGDTMRLTKDTYSILNDVLFLIILTAMQYTNETITDVNDFHKKVLKNIKKDFFSRKRQLEMHELEFLKIVNDLMKVLLKILYKTERTDKDMMQYLFTIIIFCTNAFYPQLLYLVGDSKILRDLYYELDNFYIKHQVMIENNPVNVIEKIAKDEWDVYLKEF